MAPLQEGCLVEIQEMAVSGNPCMLEGLLSAREKIMTPLLESFF